VGVAFLNGLVVEIKLVEVFDLHAFLKRLRFVKAWCIVATYLIFSCVGFWDLNRAFGNRSIQLMSFRKIN